MNKPLTLMCVQPCTQYYAWQVEVMLTNFKELKIHEHYKIHCLFAYNENEPDWESKIKIIKKVEQAYANVASFFYYQDTREKPIYYIPSIRPNVLKQHLKEYPGLKDEAIFYHDCDIVFTKFPLFFERMLEDDKWYLSDTIHYIGWEYILSKGEDVLNLMCEIVGIPKKILRQNQLKSGGAQYLMKGVDSEFFEKVEKDCEKLFFKISLLSAKKKEDEPTYHEVQIWCADMWAVLWGAWMRGFDTEIDKALDFCWATDKAEKWEETNIYHNAGVLGSMQEKLFFKGGYFSKLPFLESFETLTPRHCSYKYAEIIKSIGENSCLL